jgi:Ca2+-binding EF-hand superfamily protein
MKTYRSVLFAGALLLSGTVASAEPPTTFETLDTDGDGYISSTEAGARADLKESWQAIDKNTDNQLDITEFSAFEGEGRFTPPEESEEPGLGAAPY